MGFMITVLWNVNQSGDLEYIPTDINFLFLKILTWILAEECRCVFLSSEKENTTSFFLHDRIKDRHMEWNRKRTETGQRYVVE